MRFGIGLLQRFDAEDGAWSVVTPREEYDSQLTVTGEEEAVIEEYFGKDTIHIGRVGLDPARAAKEFSLHPAGTSIHLNLVFPKPTKRELRLYLSLKRKFKPAALDIWFIYCREDRLFIGFMSQKTWDSWTKNPHCD
jgi:5-methylcytosine-specific restriction protein A